MMQLNIENQKNPKTRNQLVFLHDNTAALSSGLLKPYQKDAITEQVKEKYFQFNDENGCTVVILAENVLEKCRKQGFTFFTQNIKFFDKNWTLILQASKEANYALIEGLFLSSYSFEKYKTKKEADVLNVFIEGLDNEDLQEILNLTKANFIARTLVNEPQSYLNATQYTSEIATLAKEYGFSFEFFNKEKIIALKMGGLLAVNKGSIQEPTFNILEYKGANALNSKPIVLVGKGVVYDTGGLSLKPTPASMDLMKSDMGGSAAVVGAFCAICAQQLPIHIIGLIPATDNRPGLDAVAPGDVITMMSGKTVEVLNTDAEGRLILGDALHYAKQYNPALVIDLATLTGAAARAIGSQGIVCMGNAEESIKNQLKESGNVVHERLVEFPLWEEYEPMIKSDIADIKNIGGASAGATTAGLFLQHFVDYPWMHLDIAGPAFLMSTDSYRGKNGSGVGVRLLYHFIKERSK